MPSEDKTTHVADIDKTLPEEVEGWLHSHHADDLAPEFARQGVTDLQYLEPNDIEGIVKAANGTPIMVHQLQGALQEWKNAHKPAPQEDKEAIEEKQKKIKNAIEEVQALRKQAEEAARTADEKKTAEVKGELEKLRARLREEGLGTFPLVGEKAEQLQNVLDTMEKDFSAVQEKLLEAVDKASMTAEDFINQFQMLKGRCIYATEIETVSAGDLVEMPQRASRLLVDTNDLNTQHSEKYNSQKAMQIADRIIETMGSSFATANEASVGGFLGSGIGAMNVAVTYAQSKQDEEDRFSENSSTEVKQIQTNFLWAPKKNVALDTLELQLSDSAKRSLRGIVAAGKAGDDTGQRARVKDFITGFGSHIFALIKLGGYYKHTATATVTSMEKRQELEKAVARASELVVSASASYAGLGGAGSVSSGTKQDDSLSMLAANKLGYTFSGIDVTITTESLGGAAGLSADLWLVSLQYPREWHVIGLEQPYPVWRLIDQAAETEPDLKPFPRLFEEVWVQDIFVRSLEPLDPEVAKIIREKGVRTAEDLESTLREYMPIEIDIKIKSTTVRKTAASGSPLAPFDEKSTSPVHTWHIRWDGDKIVGFKWTYFDDPKEYHQGNVGGPHDNKEVSFERGETLKKSNVYVHPGYGGGDGPWSGIDFETTRQSFNAGTGWSAHPLDKEVAGRCLMGFHGSRYDGSENPHIKSIGLWLSRPMQPPELPIVTVAGKQMSGDNPPAGGQSSGFHVIVSDASGIRLNRYFMLPDAPIWSHGQEDIERLYRDIVQSIRTRGLDQKGNRLILASFGMDLHLGPPTKDAIDLFRSAGADHDLQEWIDEARKQLPDWGEETIRHYILIGYFGSKPGDAGELFTSKNPAQLSDKRSLRPT